MKDWSQFLPQDFTSFFQELQEPKRLVAFTKFAKIAHMEPGELQDFGLFGTHLHNILEDTE